MTVPIAIVGIACRYPDADSPAQLWSNVLSRRRAFRQLPPERVRADDYAAPDPAAPDRTYSTQAAVLDGWEFDRVRFRIAGSTFRSTDLAHWLALEVAADALADAGWPDADGLPRDRAGVLVGNTLTGEFSRARILRLRWPYVRRTLGAALADEGYSPEAAGALLRRVEAAYKRPFAPIDADALAGSLSNTIAGRICNSFDLGGGGYTVDGACAASLLAVANACTALGEGDVDVALAGGVDLSLDPFELVGFAKTGALAREQMRVYDRASQGFWPGEGCGFVVLERLADAVARGARTYAVIRGWGISSDGAGGITRPEVAGQLLAVRRAYRRAGFGIGTVDLFEGHGTGTEVGDRTELTTLTRARLEERARTRAAIGSIKANIGHTKAAAGVAGLIKATLSLHERALPPTTGCEHPHELLEAPDAVLRALADAEPWPSGRPRRAAVSAMGFGGINSHVVLEGRGRARRRLTREQLTLQRSDQDAELVLLAGADARELRTRVDAVRAVAEQLSLAELGDLAAALQRALPPPAARRERAAVVAATPAELARALDELAAHLREGGQRLRPERGWFAGAGDRAPPVGLLFPGQGSPSYLDCGALGRRYPWLVGSADGPSQAPDVDVVNTAVAQPAIVACSLAGLALLRRLGLRAAVAVGHSLGELTALHWAGAIGAAELTALARARGAAMAELGSGDGAMASIAAGADEVERLLGPDVVIAGLNGPRQTAVAGPAAAVDAAVREARRRGIRAVRLPVSHAFHSPLVAAATEPLAAVLERLPRRPLRRPVASTVTGRMLAPDADLRDLLVTQVTQPVRFMAAFAHARDRADVFVEVGPGSVLSGLARDAGAAPALSLDVGGRSLRPALAAAAALFATGAARDPAAVFAGRFTRPFSLDRPRLFLASPCEAAPADVPSARAGTVEVASASTDVDEPPAADGEGPAAAGDGSPSDTLAVVRQLVAERVELPEAAVSEGTALLGDLHLTSIVVSELVAAAAARLDLPPPAPPTELARATVADVAAALDAVRAGAAGAADEPDGVAAWVRTFATRLEPRPRPASRAAPCRWTVLAPDDHPLADAIRGAFAGRDGEPAVLVCLPPDLRDEHAPLLLRAADEQAASGARRLAVLQHGGGGGGFARSLHLERPDVSTCVIDMPPDRHRLADARREAEAATVFREVHLGADGARLVPVLRPLTTTPGSAGLGRGDVLLVSGGGKGIGAECALALAAASGAAVALLGRSEPGNDAELAATLDRFAALGVPHRYVVADVADAAATRAAVATATQALGPPTAILHAAGVNVPARIDDLDDATLDGTLAPKVRGLRNLLAAVDRDRLRTLVCFGSIIGRIGLRGEAHYALANDWLARLVDRLRGELPRCRCLNLEWSVWTGAGMGDRLGTVAALAQQGVTPIPVDEGVRRLGELLGSVELPPSVVVAGRFGAPPTVDLDPPPLPLLRFLERPRVHYPGVELVTEAELSLGTDPYLADHRLDGTALLPAVLALEAVASVARALARTADRPVLEDVRFDRAVTVPSSGSRTIRVACLRRADGAIDASIRTDETAFQADHVRARCHFRAEATEACPAAPAGRLPLDPGRELYGSLLFHGARFQRLLGYRELQARRCVAEIDARAERWFGAFLPQDLVLGDPGARDAAIHAVQACIPHARLIPVGVERIAGDGLPPGRVLVHARERHGDGERFVYDLLLACEDGHVCERWDGLELRSIAPLAGPERWPVPLLAPYLERRLADLVEDAGVSVAVVTETGRAGADGALRSLVGPGRPTRRRADGRPVAAAPGGVSAAHLDGCTLAVAGPGAVGCDVEAATPHAWPGLLGAERLELARLLAIEVGEELDVAATRVWAAIECVKKAGLPVTAPLKLGTRTSDGWIILRAAGAPVATLVTRVSAVDDAVAIAVLAGGADG